MVGLSRVETGECDAECGTQTALRPASRRCYPTRTCSPPAASESRSTTTRSAHAAFTLLEVLITAILLATLLAGVWSLYQTFGALYDTGFVQTEKALMVRSLTQQISSDLLSTVSPVGMLNTAPTPSLSDGLSSAGRATTIPSCATRVGLLGTYNTLRLDILQADPPFTGQPQLSEVFSATEDNVSSHTGEIVTVLYTFVPPAMTETDVLADKPGFMRREIRINRSSENETRLLDVLAESPGLQYPSAGSWNSNEIVDTTAGGLTATADGSQLPRTVTTHLPEVVAFEFRYFDGQDWTDAWDSRTRKSLPSAVEVAFELQFAQEPKPRATDPTGTQPAHQLAQTDESPTRSPVPVPIDSLATLGQRTPSYRFVVYLPQSAILNSESRFRAGPGGDEPAAAPGSEPEIRDIGPVSSNRKSTL